MDWKESELENDDLKNYKAKAEYYIRQHQDHIVIHKLKNNVPLTEIDVKALEEILWSEIGTKEDYEAEYGNKPLGEFVREIVGLDMNAAKEAFAEYWNDTSLDSRQAFVITNAVDIKPLPPEHSFFFCGKNAPGQPRGQDRAERVHSLAVKGEGHCEPSMRAQQFPGLFQEQAGLWEVVIGVEGHQHVEARLLVSEKILMHDMDAGIKEKLFSGHVCHALGDIHAFDLAGAVLQQIHEHGAAAAADIQHAGAAPRDRNGGGNDPGHLCIGIVIVPIGGNRIIVFGMLHVCLLFRQMAKSFCPVKRSRRPDAWRNLTAGEG